MDEAASRLRMQVDSKPEELDEIDRRIMQLQIEREALKKETDQASKDRLVKLEKELAEFEEKSAGMTRRWQEEKEQLASASKVKEELEEARFELEQAQRKGDFAKAGELAYATIPGLEKKLKEAEEISSSTDARGGGDREPRGTGRVALDRRSGRQDAGRRAREAASPWRRSWPSASSASPMR